MNKGQCGRLRDTYDVQKMLKFEVVPDLHPRAHFAHRFFHTHTKTDNILSINIHAYSIYTIIYSIIYIYNIIITNYIYSIYGICDILCIYNILCNIKNRWARGRTTAKVLSINGFETFASAPFASTCPHFPELLIKGNAPSPDISVFYCKQHAFLTISPKCPEISTFFPLVSHLISEHNHKNLDIPAFSSWFQRLFDNDSQKDLILQHNIKTEPIHMSKSDSCIKVSEIRQ